MFYLPGMLKQLDAQFYAEALERQLASDARLATPDLIDAHFVWPDGVGAWLVARRRGLPFVCTLRGKLVSQIRQASKRRQIVDMLLDADALIAVSTSLAELARRVTGKQLKIHVIPNGVDAQQFFLEEALTGNAEHSDSTTSQCVRATKLLDELSCATNTEIRHVVSVGHLQHLKGFHRLIDVWPAVCRRAGPAQLILVGGSTGEAHYEAQLFQAADIANARIGGNPPAIVFAGQLPPDDLRRVLNCADLFALASTSEGWCNSIAEALACGCPVVATDVGGNREQILHADLGALVPLHERAALIDALCGSLNRDWDRRAIAKHGQRRNWSDVAAQCVDVYKRVC